MGLDMICNNHDRFPVSPDIWLCKQGNLENALVTTTTGADLKTEYVDVVGIDTSIFVIRNKEGWETYRNKLRKF